MRRAAPLFILAAALACQSEPPQDIAGDAAGIWLRNDGGFVNGVSLDGSTTSFEEYADQSIYRAIEHRVSKNFETYTITTGRWNYYDSLFTVRYAYRYTFTLKGEPTSKREGIESIAVVKVIDLDKTTFEYEIGGEGRMAFIKGDYPASFDQRFLRPFGRYLEMNPDAPRIDSPRGGRR